MNLLKLLTVGESLKEGKTVLGKYKISDEPLVPRFASTVRPSKPRACLDRPASASVDTQQPPAASANPVPPITLAQTELEPVEPPAAAPVSAEQPAARLPEPISETIAPSESETTKTAAPSEMAPAGAATAEEVSPLPMVPAQTKTILKPAEQPAPFPPPTGRTTRLLRRVNAIIRAVLPKRAPRRGSVFAVQTEWSLEKVTVVRNDLSDADLELVSRKPVRTQAPPGSANGPVPTHHGLAWSKVSRWFKHSSPFEQKNAAPKVEEPAPSRRAVLERI